MRPLLALCLLIGLAAPLAAQPSRVTQAQADAFSIRGEGFFAGQWFAASQTFDAAFGSNFGPFYGGGVVMEERGIFFEVTGSHFSKTGQRAFVSGGQTYPLGIPLTASVTPFEFTFGYRFRRRQPIMPYLGAGVGAYSYSETSPSSAAGEDVDAHHAGYLVVGGAEFRIHRLIGIAADVQYTGIPGILGNAGLSKAFGETNLGGTAFHIKVLVGKGR
jgi:opacity protein-like surface antigen